MCEARSRESRADNGAKEMGRKKREKKRDAADAAHFKAMKASRLSWYRALVLPAYTSLMSQRVRGKRLAIQHHLKSRFGPALEVVVLQSETMQPRLLANRTGERAELPQVA